MIGPATLKQLMNNQYSRRHFIGATFATAALVSVTRPSWAATERRRVLVWSERTAPAEVYPNDINGAIAEGLKSLADWEIITAHIDQPDQGVTEDSLKQTDVLIWWGHKRHEEIKSAKVDLIEKRVKEAGMGFISVHSSHFALPYKRLMGTPCSWAEYKVDGSSLTVKVKDASHPIAKGIREFTLPKVERYSEPYQVPEPEAVPLEGLYHRPDGKEESARIGLCWTVGKGKVFYFQPGHETYPYLFRDDVRQIFRNAVSWAAPAR
jgi:trehalose utilization protein